MLQAEIENIDHPLMRLTQALLGPEGRATQQQFIIDDPENILTAIEAGIHVRQVFVYGEAEMHQDFLAQLPNIPCYPIRPRTCKKLFGVDKHARVFAIADFPAPKTLAEIQGDLAVLDGLMLTGNIGAIIRSAMAFGLGGIALLNMSQSQLFDRRLIRASKAYLFKLPLVCIDQDSLSAYCRDTQIKLVSCAQKADATLDSIAALPERLAFILGAEKAGLSASSLAASDYSIRIPMTDAVESLNVSVAAAIIFHARFCKHARKAFVPSAF